MSAEVFTLNWPGFHSFHYTFLLESHKYASVNAWWWLRSHVWHQLFACNNNPNPNIKYFLWYQGRYRTWQNLFEIISWSNFNYNNIFYWITILSIFQPHRSFVKLGLNNKIVESNITFTRISSLWNIYDHPARIKIKKSCFSLNLHLDTQFINCFKFNRKCVNIRETLYYFFL